MKYLVMCVLLCAPAAAQNNIETFFNLSTRAFDAGQTCYILRVAPRAREAWLPTNSCAGVAAFDAGFAVGSWLGDRWLTRHGMRAFAHLQSASIAGAGIAVTLNLKDIHYR